MGPNVKKLVIYKISRDAIPDGGGVAAGIGFLSDKNRVADGVRKATKWVDAAIAAVKLAAEPNPWKDADEEAIAGEILRKIEDERHELTS